MYKLRITSMIIMNYLLDLDDVEGDIKRKRNQDLLNSNESREPRNFHRLINI